MKRAREKGDEKDSAGSATRDVVAARGTARITKCGGPVFFVRFSFAGRFVPSTARSFAVSSLARPRESLFLER